MSAGVARDAEAAASGLRYRLGGRCFSRGRGGGGRWSHLVGDLRHDSAKADHERGKDHYVTHHATLDQRTRIRGFADITTAAEKLRPTMPDEACDFGEKDDRRVNERPGRRELRPIIRY
jgi:hypothetical protein